VNSTAQRLVIALPSKGRLQQQCLDFLKGCGFDVRRLGNGREYVSTLSGLDDVDVIFLRPEEIPERVEQGDAHTGITGEDLFREHSEGPPASSLLLPKLGFGAARLVVAVPQSWVDVGSMGDLDEAAMLFHQRHGRTLRAATKFSRLTRTFFAEWGLVEYSLVGSSGATEGAPAAGAADFIVDLTSTGATLAENHLKEIAGGTVLKTEACLIASLRHARWNPRALAALEQLVEQIEARMRASSHLILRFSLPREAAVHKKLELKERYGCVLSTSGAAEDSAPGTERAFLAAICERKKLYAIAQFLRSAGATEIVAERGEFIFAGSSPAFEGFRQTLQGGAAVPGREAAAE
jgi:ATP phosphoribosyltransferase